MRLPGGFGWLRGGGEGGGFVLLVVALSGVVRSKTQIGINSWWNALDQKWKSEGVVEEAELAVRHRVKLTPENADEEREVC
ncbi:hypothetical protein RchiOBHm_Chr1g0373681 [Rosa chinensis]|uniref:Uncharacterized protein n=1 Tax=Rosa chinensis TaxID=74649 RepID=A0A2P6SM46_ROSCH|nr:hypothetical protein RchiOBHm_Chr1g0373681 [Rosa chinensis]